MTQESIESEQPFRDFYEVLHLHPEADAAMVDQAYWHLARLYNAAIPDDTEAREKLDDLNEAYSVLRSAELRGSYDQVRNELLGEGALPFPKASLDTPPFQCVLKLNDRLPATRSQWFTEYRPLPKACHSPVRFRFQPRRRFVVRGRTPVSSQSSIKASVPP